MPNWIRGTMKLRGDRKNIKRFFTEGLEASHWIDEEKLEDQVTDNSNEYELYMCFQNEPHIIGTRRAFITDDSVTMDMNEETEGIACVDIKQAWSFTDGGNADKWKAISDKYDLDLKLYGVECGMQFVQEIIILRGKNPIDNVIQYKDWDWECPFPNMGG